MTAPASRLPHTLTILSFAMFAAAACGGKASETTHDSTPAAPEVAAGAPVTVPTIDSVKCTVTASPLQLTVTAYATVNSGGFTSPTLKPRVYVAAPAGGIWEYDFTAVGPTGMATMALTPIEASVTTPDVPNDGYKGIRVYGADAGVKEVAITACGKA